jgi:hypothetical protein
LVLLALLLVLGRSSASGLPRIPHIAFIRPVQSPLVKDLTGLGPIVRPRDPLADLLVVDGDAYSGTMAEEELLRKAWKVGKGFLILDADEADFKEDLIRLTGIVPSRGVAAVYLRKRRDGGVDQVQLDARARTTSSTARRARKEFLRQVAQAFREELPVRPIHRDNPAGDQGVKVAQSSGSEFQIGPFPITKVDIQPITGTIASPFSSTNVPQEMATLSLNDQIEVVGSGSNGGQSPATAYITFQGSGSSSVQNFDTFELGFFQDNAVVSGYANPQHQRLVGLAFDQGTPVLVDSEPQNAAGQATVTSGFMFSIGVTPMGPGLNATYSALTTTQIAGWAVTETPAGPGDTAFQWTYQEQLDANNKPMSSIYANLSAGNTYLAELGGDYAPSALAAGLVESAPMVVWTATESAGTQQATVSSQLTAANTYWSYIDPLLSPSMVELFLDSDNIVSTDGSVVISLTDLWNQMGYLSSVSVPATVSEGTQMSVTVTLDHPAPQAGMPITMNSSSPDIIASGLTLLVPGGNESFTFQIPVYKVGSGEVTLTFQVNGLSMSANTTVQ